MTTLDIQRLAAAHLDNGAPMASSAHLAFADALALKEQGECALAEVRFLDSLAYSVGVFHADYARVARAICPGY